MKNKVFLVLVSSYIFLILIILAIGLKVQKTDQLMITGTGAAPGTITSQPDDDLFQFSKTAIDNNETQTWIETPSAAVETLLPLSVEPTKTQTITAISQEPTQTKRTSTTSAPTSTQSAYPVPGEGTAIATTTSPPYPVEDVITSTLSPTSTVTPSYTSTTQTGWLGDWTVFWQQADGGFLSGLMSVSVDGSDVTASVSIGEDQYEFTGILNESIITIVGSWSGSLESGNFYWRTLGLDQFSGNLDRQFGFCGSRSGGVRPEPCLDVPSDK